MSEEFDAEPYARLPMFDVAGGVGLGCGLLAALPHHPTAEVRRAAHKLRRTTLALQSAWGQADAAPRAEDRRPADVVEDNAWGVLHDRLDAYARLPVEHFPRAKRAQEILALLYLEGEGFLKLPYVQEWAEGEKRLALIRERGLERDIDALAGPEFLLEVKRAHAKYGDAVGMTRARPGTEPLPLAEPLRLQRQAMQVYVLAVCAMAGDQGDTIRAARAALKPIDEFRADSARRATSGGTNAAPAVTPTTPVPEVPAGSA